MPDNDVTLGLLTRRLFAGQERVGPPRERVAAASAVGEVRSPTGSAQVLDDAPLGESWEAFAMDGFRIPPLKRC